MSRNQTEALAANAVYTLYQKAALAAGEPLTREVFETLWNGLGVGDRAYWLGQFRGGRTTLTRTVVDDLEAVVNSLESGGPVPDEKGTLLEALRQRVESRKMLR